MPHELALALGLLTAITIWLAIKHAMASHRTAQQLLIVQSGETCLGKIVAVQRPFMLDDCTRFYFDFVPCGRSEAIRACHIARAGEGDRPRALPAQGSTVTVRYLPERPQRAVIGKLVIG